MKRWTKYIAGASVAFAFLLGAEILAKEEKKKEPQKAEPRAAKPLSLEEQFKKFDLNKDGKITLDEAKKSGLLKALQPRPMMARRMGPEMRRRMEEMSPERRREMMQRMRRRRQAMTPEQRERLREFGAVARGALRERMRAISPEKRKELAEKFPELPPEERKEKIRAFLKETRTKYARAKFLESLSPRQRELYLQMVGPEERERLAKYFRQLDERKRREEFFRNLSPEQRRWMLQAAPPEKARELQKILRALPSRPRRPTLRGPVRPGGRLEPFRLRRGRRRTRPGLAQPEGPMRLARGVPAPRPSRFPGQVEPRQPGARPRVEMKGAPPVAPRPEGEFPAERGAPKLFRRPLASPEPLPFGSGEGLLEEDWDVLENWETLESLGAFGE